MKAKYLVFCKDCVYSYIGTWDCECRRHPPKFIDGSVNVFPLIDPLSWCGEFKKEEQEHVKKDKTESKA